MIVVIGKNRLGPITEVHEELNISGGTQHGAGIKLVGIDRRTFNLEEQSFSHTMALMSGTHGEQSDHADAGHRPKAHGTDDRSSFFRHENMFLPRVLFQTLESFRGPAADLVDAVIFAEREVLHLKKSRKIDLRRWSNVSHGVNLKSEKNDPTFITEGCYIRKDDCLSHGRQRETICRVIPCHTDFIHSLEDLC